MTTLKDLLNDMLVDYGTALNDVEVLDAESEEEIRKRVLEDYIETITVRLIGS